MRNALHPIRLKAMLFALLLGWGCPAAGAQPADGSMLKMTLATQAAPYSGLVLVAAQKGYFKEAGLAVTLSLHPSGKEAMEAMCQGKAEVATAADIALAAKALAEPSLRVLASIGTTTGSQIVARKDRNIHHPVDLRGKRIGYTVNTTSDYFLYSFLVIENIARKDITFVDIPADRQVEALVSGSVDAVSAFEIFAFRAKTRLGERAIYWDIQNNLAFHWLLMTTAGRLDQPERFRRLLTALLMAETFTRTNDAETRQILSQQWGFEPGFLQEAWPRTRLTVTFGQSIVTSLKSYLQWRLLKSEKSAAMPDVFNYLHTGILDEVAPKTVTIFR